MDDKTFLRSIFLLCAAMQDFAQLTAALLLGTAGAISGAWSAVALALVAVVLVTLQAGAGKALANALSADDSAAIAIAETRIAWSYRCALLCLGAGALALLWGRLWP